MTRICYSLFVLGLPFCVSSQNLIGPNSNHIAEGGYFITYSVGESIVGYIKDESSSVLIGVQQPLYENMYGLPSLTYSTIAANPTQIDADGTSTSSITVRLKDGDNEVIPWGGEMVEIIPTLGTMTSVTDNNNGTYAATLTSSTAPGTSTVNFEVNGFQGNNTAEVDFLADCVDVPDDVDIPDGDLGSQTIIARKTISTGGSVMAGNEVTLVSGTSITLTAGFTVQPGALFSARIDNNLARIANCEDIIAPPIVFEDHNNIIQENLELYPNPSTGEVNLQFNLENASMVTLRVYDFMGKLIQTFKEGTQYYSGLNAEELNLSLLKGGVYTIQVATKEWIASKSLVIVKN